MRLQKNFGNADRGVAALRGLVAAAGAREPLRFSVSLPPDRMDRAEESREPEISLHVDRSDSVSRRRSSCQATRLKTNARTAEQQSARTIVRLTLASRGATSAVEFVGCSSSLPHSLASRNRGRIGHESDMSSHTAGSSAISLRVLLPIAVGFFLVSTLLAWSGAVVALRCEHDTNGRVDVTVEYRVLGLVSAVTERLTDVVAADWFQQTGGRRRAGSAASGMQLRLTERDGRVWESTPAATYIIGTPPSQMADRIREFLAHPTDPPIAMRWTPWLMNALAVPFLLFSALFALAILNQLRGTRSR